MVFSAYLVVLNSFYSFNNHENQQEKIEKKEQICHPHIRHPDQSHVPEQDLVLWPGAGLPP
jgi:hypothetical protein